MKMQLCVAALYLPYRASRLISLFKPILVSVYVHVCVNVRMTRLVCLHVFLAALLSLVICDVTSSDLRGALNLLRTPVGCFHFEPDEIPGR